MQPSDLSLPSKFTSFRPAQVAALEFCVESTSRWTALGLPTGAGKTLIGIALAKLLGARVCYLVSTKALQDQVSADFQIADIRGKDNYHCAPYKRSCRHGEEQGCSHSGTLSCPYFSAVDHARRARAVVTNYAYWLYSRRNNATGGIGNFDLLVCDECCAVEEELGRFLSSDFDQEEWAGDLPTGKGLLDASASAAPLKDWAALRRKDLRDALAQMSRHFPDDLSMRRDPDYLRLSSLRDRFTRLYDADADWVWQSDGKKLTLDCIHPGRYSSFLWSTVPRIVLMSATLRPYTLSLCGLKRDSYSFKEWPSVFPPQYGPVYYLPTVKMNWRSTDEDYVNLVRRIDDIIGARLDRKGIIHTVSYERAQRIAALSQHRERLVYNRTGRETGDVAQAFRRLAPPRVLISPSFSTGHDFPGEECEYIIIVKVPFPDTTSYVMEKRCEDEEYRFYLAVQAIVQMSGRGRRYADDRCECFLLDKNFSFAMARGRQFAPAHWKTFTVQSVPKTPPRVRTARLAAAPVGVTVCAEGAQIEW